MNKRDKAKQDYVDHIVQSAKMIAKDKDEPLMDSHMIAVMLEQLAKSFVLNQELINMISNLDNDIESIRRYIDIGNANSIKLA